MVCPPGTDPYDATVTVCPTGDGFYMQLNDTINLKAANMKTSPFGDKEVRAKISFYTTSPISAMQEVTVYSMDSIRTKTMSPDLLEGNVAAYGNDPVEIVKDWQTSVECGYLTLRVRTKWTNGYTHGMSLVRTDEPYSVRLYHDNVSDPGLQVADALIAFKLTDIEEPDGQEHELKLTWDSYTGEKSTVFKFKH